MATVSKFFSLLVFWCSRCQTPIWIFIKFSGSVYHNMIWSLVGSGEIPFTTLAIAMVLTFFSLILSGGFTAQTLTWIYIKLSTYIYYNSIYNWLCFSEIQGTMDFYNSNYSFCHGNNSEIFHSSSFCLFNSWKLYIYFDWIFRISLPPKVDYVWKDSGDSCFHGPNNLKFFLILMFVDVT